MIRINVKETLKAAEEAKNAPKPLPKVVVIGRDASFKASGPSQPAPVEEIQPPALPIPDHDALIQSLEREFNAIKLERNKLSSQIWKMVENSASQSELYDHYHKIEAYRPQLQALYDKIDFVKLHGHLPEVKEEQKPEETLYYLKDLKKRLSDKRCKLQKKIQLSEAKNPTKVSDWHIALDLAEAEYEAVELKIKKLEGKA